MNATLEKIRIVKELAVLLLLLVALVTSCESKRAARDLLDDVATLRLVVEEVKQTQ